MSLASMIAEMGKEAKRASRKVRKLERPKKDAALELMALKLLDHQDEIMRQNEKDLVAAGEAGLSSAMIDRLTLDEKVIRGMADGLREVIALPDPVGQVTGMWKRPNGLLVGRVRIPWVSSASSTNPVPM